MMKMQIIGLFLCIGAVLCHTDSKGLKRKHPVPSYFRKVNENGELIDRDSPEYDSEIPKKFSSWISRDDALSAMLKVSPAVVANGGKVNVSWAGVTNPQPKDFIGLYCPVNDDPKHYLDYFYVNVASTWKDGHGQHEVIVYNMRSKCSLRYYRNGQYSQLVATSNQFDFKDGGAAAPLQGHISLTGNPTEMRVMWVSGKVDAPYVRYGLSKEVELRQRVGIESTYNASAMCEGPATEHGFWKPGYIYNFVLKELKPNTRYFYSFGTEEHMSDIFNFTTDIPVGEETPFTWIIYGDMGVGGYPSAVGTENLMMKEIQENKARLIFHHGDISYARGYAYIWEQWFTLIQPYATQIPYMIGIGNHEQDHEHGGERDPSGAPGQGFHPPWGNFGHDSGGECGVPMNERFVMPDNGNKVWWYSFNYGLVHYIMMSTEHDYTPGSRQYKWLESNLKSVDRKVTPFVIIAGHRAMYCSEMYIGDYIVAEQMQHYFEDLLYKYKVDMAFWAHYHSYERTCKVYKGRCVDDGIVHIVVGSAGAGLDTDIWFERDWSEFHINDWGYGRLTVANRTAMKYEWVQNRSGKVLDSVWVKK